MIIAVLVTLKKFSVVGGSVATSAGVTIALEKNNKKIIEGIVKYASGMSDIQGNTILHYAAKTSSIETVKNLLSYGIATNVKNVAGDTPYTVAVRWKRPDIAELLKGN